VAWNRPLPEEK